MISNYNYNGFGSTNKKIFYNNYKQPKNLRLKFSLNFLSITPKI